MTIPEKDGWYWAKEELGHPLGTIHLMVEVFFNPHRKCRMAQGYVSHYLQADKCFPFLGRCSTTEFFGPLIQPEERETRNKMTIPRREGWHWMQRHSVRDKGGWTMAWVAFSPSKQRWVAHTYFTDFTDDDNEGADFHGPIIPPNLCIS